MIMNYKSKRVLRGAFVLVSLHIFLNGFGQINFGTQSNFKYLKGVDAENISSNWYVADFDDSAWPQSNAPFRYGDGSGGTELLDMSGSYSTVFLRSSFTAAEIENIEEVKIGVNWDDGFILWINGNEVLSRQAPANVSFDAVSNGLHESGSLEFFNISPSDMGLVNGQNSIAVLACNVSKGGSSDFYYDMNISATPDVPEFDTIGAISFSHSSGFYQSSFSLSLTTSIEGAQIVYTLDGSNPQTSLNSMIAESSAVIEVNPENIYKRAATPAVTVRASVVKDGLKPSKPQARTFIYLDKVREQAYPGGNWPDYNVNGQELDMAMDPEVVKSSMYKDLIDDALLDIPTISLITGNRNIFDPGTGIYVNALEQGKEWERECAVELINPDGSEGFNINAGLRIRGGWSRHDNYPKHAFRLFFREEYGYNKLNFPLFGDEGVDEFDKIDLRCAQNYSWSNSSGEHNTFVREVFARDAQADAGQPYTRSRYYHLYLNGMYWGVYQTQERSEARFAESYFGGDHEDYDVVKKVGVRENVLEATDGTLDKWEEVYAKTRVGFSINESYFSLEGKDAEGKIIPGAEVFVDIDNLIDYMINIFYSGNFDGPVSAFGSNKSPNNMYAITNRENKSFGFKFFVHDGEHSMLDLNENRVNIADIAGGQKMEVNSFSKFHTQWLHHRLSSNNEYRIRFANRAWNQLTGNGIFTPDKSLERFNNRASQVEMAIIAESARWGDAHRNEPYTKDNAWLPELDVLRFNYFPYRPDRVISQLDDYNLFPDVEAPLVKRAGESVYSGIETLSMSGTISVENPVPSGEIYYTINGEDPRKVGGDVSVEAEKISSGSSLEISKSLNFKARVLKDSKWSAMVEITFVLEQLDFSDLKITEIHYHPLDSINGNDTIPGTDYEFIEFKNISTTDAINLTGLVIDSAIFYEFPEGYLLMPREYFVVADKPSKFYDRYQIESSGNFSKNLSNGGEQIIITNAQGELVFDFFYDDKEPWPEEPDGDGPSLVAVNIDPQGDPGLYYYWKASSVNHGTPFYQEGAVGISEELASANVEPEVLVYPNPSHDIVNILLNEDFNKDADLKILTVDGILVHAEVFNKKVSVDLSSLNLHYGVYFVIIESVGYRKIQKIIYAPN